MKKGIAIFLTLLLIWAVPTGAQAEDTLSKAAAYLLRTCPAPNVSSVGGEWSVIGLSRSGLDIPSSYFEQYYANLEKYVQAREGVLHARKHTEYARVALAVQAIGKNPENVAGYDLTAPLLSYEKTVSQGINGAIWALIALDTLPHKNIEIREKYVAYILSAEHEGGGWALSASCAPDADITAMALLALSTHAENETAQNAIDRGILLLSKMQTERGGYQTYGRENAESCAQVLTALSALGISSQDARFVKNGHTLPEALLSFQNAEGAFLHDGEANLMTTEQCFYALVAAKRFTENKAPLFAVFEEERQAAVALTSFFGIGLALRENSKL